jgi:hypothetical protein
MAYENFKESQRLVHRPNHARRKSLNVILDSGLMGGRLRGFDRETLLKLKDLIDQMSPERRELLFATARVNKSKSTKRGKIRS